MQVPLDDLMLPEHSGHLWRSVLLARLKIRRGCILKELQRRSGKGKTVNLWALEPPTVESVVPAGTPLAGSVVLFDEAMSHVGEVLGALHDFEHQGLGLHRHYVPMQLVKFAVTGVPGTAGGPEGPLDAWRLMDAAAQEAEAIGPAAVQMQLLTPTDFTDDNRSLRHAPSFARLLHFGHRRLADLVPADLPGGLFAPGEAESWQAWAATVGLAYDATRFTESQRFSRSQQGEVPLRGLCEQAAYTAPAAWSWPWLRLFEHLQLGKKVTHGQGVVRFRSLG